MKKVAYFPGCSLAGMDAEYDHASRLAALLLGIELVEVEDWSCCGATSAHSTDHELSVLMPARTLGIVEKMGLDTLTAPCASCYSRFVTTGHKLKEDRELASRIMPELGISSPDAVKVRSLLHMIADMPRDFIKEKIKLELPGLRPACYYGCLLSRPSAVVGEAHPESPVMMDDLMALTGARPVKWYHKTECCGAALSIPRTDVVLELTSRLMKRAGEAGANCIVTACPLCFTNLDLRQSQAREYSKETGPPVPVFYFTELMALAMGAPRGKLGFGKHAVDPVPLLDEALKAQAVEGGK
ncbi:MAG: CoB--CoM heterodisulfide reductase iron-sulfur subunit B family protein [Candidatus Eremiobacteraeota bacterium]|nr:CoB--CoM heterodisulfide reductase iron-sulfur subunit B family protein [Candidatus Eremiobacteraeota bacterium]